VLLVSLNPYPAKCLFYGTAKQLRDCERLFSEIYHASYMISLSSFICKTGHLKKCKDYTALQFAIFSSLLSLIATQVQIFSATLFSNALNVNKNRCTGSGIRKIPLKDQ
jgi:hypothetical protein